MLFEDSIVFFKLILGMADANQPRPNKGREPSPFTSRFVLPSKISAEELPSKLAIHPCLVGL